MARKGNPISVRLYLNRSSDSSWFSDYYYGKLVYQNVNLRSYFGSPPTTKVSLGRCIILHFSKRTFIHFFLPHGRRRLKRRKKNQTRKGEGIRESGADQVSSFKRQYRRRTKQSERPGGREKSRVDQARRPGEGKRNQDLAEKEGRLWIP